MRIELPDDRIRLDGVTDVESSPGRVVPHRLDRRFAHQFPIEVSFMEGMPSGVRLVVDTDADTVGVECTPVRLVMGEDERRATFDVVVDGERTASVDAHFGHVVTVDIEHADVDFTSGERGVVDLPLGDGGRMRTVEIWLPQAAGLELHALTVPDGAEVVASPPSTRPRWVHHGSSISHCMEADGPSRTWPAVASASTGYDLHNIGLAGQCHLDQFTARTIRDLPADRISLKLGINVVNADSMTERTFTSAVHGFLDTVREGHPDTPLLVISPIHCPSVEDLPGPTVLGDDGRVDTDGTEADLLLGRLSLTRIRRILHDVVEARRGFGDLALHHLDGLELFGPDDADHLGDGLHPDADGYVLIGERFARHGFLDD